MAEILDCCQNIVVNEGLAAATITRLGRELSIDRSTIYHYIGSQSSLYEALVARIVDSFHGQAQAELSEHPPDVDRYLDTVFSPDFLFPDLDKVMDEFEARGWHDTSIRKHVERFYAQQEENSTQYLIAALSDLPRPVARKLAQSIHALLEGAYLLQNWGAPKSRRKAAKEAAKLLVKATRDAHT
ncbi:MAG: TetR/AcrR family transcriptional regulator [Pseudomonadota bacterium]